MRVLGCLIATGVLALSAGCGSGDSGGGSADKPSAKATPKAVVTVSESAVCSLLVDDDDSALNGLVDFVVKDVEQEKDPEARATAEDDVAQLRNVAKRAPESMQTQIVAIADEGEGLFKALDEGIDWESTAFKASALDVTTTCQDLGY